MKITDGKKTVIIKMYGVNNAEFSADFFNAGGLPYDDETDCYFVKDIDYCIDQAMDCQNGEGDYKNDDMPSNCTVYVEDVETETAAKYRVKPEYMDLWLAAGEESDELIVEYDDIVRLSYEWNKPLKELLEQVEQI